MGFDVPRGKQFSYPVHPFFLNPDPLQFTPCCALHTHTHTRMCPFLLILSLSLALLKHSLIGPSRPGCVECFHKHTHAHNLTQTRFFFGNGHKRDSGVGDDNLSLPPRSTQYLLFIILTALLHGGPFRSVRPRVSRLLHASICASMRLARTKPVARTWL